ncbi:hypothetical protein ACRZQL_000002 [Salmonella enterica subsp. enterica serovar Worthington]
MGLSTLYRKFPARC